jgi:hypothetical protein
MPSGGLIAYFQKSSFDESKVDDVSTKAGILFSEKNSLRHGQFYLENLNISDITPKTLITCKIIKWNLDLPMLMAYLE